ncbi:MAG: hypothetical protein F4205_02925 [Gemmatimonadetes bacterium]|nr:hypothetical protein [Gemmatimonadota bacterium]MYG34425.1 hypothetical protein [Gemmatimonadota bacterium]
MPGTDAEIAARIAAVAHEPFREVWRRHAEQVWEPVRRVLAHGVAAHERALDELGSVSAGDGPDGVGSASEVGEAADRYRHAVATGVLEPLRQTLRDHDAAGKLEASLGQAVEQVVAVVAKLPALVRAPISPTALQQARGLGVWVALKRVFAMALRPLLWRREARDIPMAAVAREHVARSVLPQQVRAFRNSQRLRGEWLGNVERSWSGWLAAVLARPDGMDARGERRPESAPGRNDLEACLEAGNVLHRRLLVLVEQVAGAAGQSLDHGLARCAEALHARVGVAGTFVSSESEGTPLGWRGQKGTAANWDRWADESVTRLDLCLELLKARRLTDRVRRELNADWTRAVREIEVSLDELDARLAEGRERAAAIDAEDAALSDKLGQERLRTGAGLDEVEATLPDPGQLLDALTDAATRADGELEDLAAAMPEELVVHRVPPGDTRLRKPAGAGNAVRLREAARQSFDTPRIERIRATATVVPGAMDRVHALVSELREVAAYGYEAAIGELTEGRDPGTVHPVLVTNGLTRASTKAEVARGALIDALDEACMRVADEVADGMAHLVHRTTTDRLTGRYLDARSQVAAEASRGRELWRRYFEDAMRRGSDAFSWIRQRLWPVKHALGIGAEAGGRAELRERSLAAVEEVESKLPVLYRRLFSLEPLTDPRLLAGRDDALAAVERSWNRWQTEPNGGLVVISSPGAGVTSFLNVVTGRLGSAPQRAVRATLRERIRDEAGLAERFSGWLGPCNAHDLHGLGGQVLDAPRLPHLFILEGTEHLQMRVAGGGELFETLLSFIQRTSPRIFWVLSVGASSWQLLEKRCPACFGDVEQLRLGELSAEALKQAILARHRLSGLPLRYVERRTGRELLRRRPGVRGSEKHQRLLESDYFERLHRASLGSVRSALFHWLRSADFRSEQGSLLVRPIETLPSLMGVFNLEQSFALKALLDHGTLTVAEYCQVARGSPAEARHLFRAIRDLHVIEAVREDGRGGTGVSAAGTRYRIRPLLLGAVTAHLRSLNVLH